MLARANLIALQKGQRRTNDADRPQQTPVQVEKLGHYIASTVPVALASPSCSSMFVARSPCGRLRHLDLLRRSAAAAVDRACAFAATSGISSLRFVRMYLQHHAIPLKLKTEHRIIPEIATYTTHFATITQGATP